MRRINLLKSLPKSKRDRKLLEERKRIKARGDDIISKRFGFDYFDGPRAYNYGGYYYDGRWESVANDIINEYNLRYHERVLDVGCAKGFLVHDLRQQGQKTFGIDISEYAVKNCLPDDVGYIHHGDALDLPFPDDSFDLVLCINLLHNFSKEDIPLALKEIMRVSRKDCFVQVDSYESEEERQLMEGWQLTVKYMDYPEYWVELFKKSGYDHDYDFTIMHEEDFG